MNEVLHRMYCGDRVSLARFNDGELGVLTGKLNRSTSRGRQKVTSKLKEALQFALKYKSDSYIKGYPCVACFPDEYSYFMSNVKERTNLMPLSSLTNNNWKAVSDEFLKLAKIKSVVYIGDDKSDIGWLNNAGIFYMLYPGFDTFEYVKQIRQNVHDTVQYSSYIYIAVGAASRYLAALLDSDGYNAIDVGSMFYPYTHGKNLKCHEMLSPYKNKQKYCHICNY
jgi:hypothetical protein